MNAIPMNRLLLSVIAAFGLLIETTHAGGLHGGSHTASTPLRTSFLPPRSHTHHHRPPTLPSPLRIPQMTPRLHAPSPIRNVGVRPTVVPQLTHSVASPIVQVQRNSLSAGSSLTSSNQAQVTSNGHTANSQAADPDRFRTHVQRNPATAIPTGLADFAPATFGAPPVEPTFPNENSGPSAPQQSQTQLTQAPAPSPRSDASLGSSEPYRPTLDELSVHLSDEEMAVVLTVLLRAQQLRDRRQSQPASTPATTPTTAPRSTGRLAVYDTQEEALEAAGRFGNGARVQTHDTGLTRNGRPILQYDVVR